MKILVTGANGFVGSSICRNLKENKIEVLPIVRRQGANGTHVIEDINQNTYWGECLPGVDVVVHAAALVHVMHKKNQQPLAEYRRVNTFGTLNLAQQAADCGVKRFVYLSSIKVNGENTKPGMSFRPEDTPILHDAYALSKSEAEKGLFTISHNTNMEVVVIRPPLVYGPGVKANFLNMMRWLDKGIPLPFGAIHNSRSLVALENLVDLIKICIHHPAAGNQTFLVSDDEDLSTTELLRKTAIALNTVARLLPVPQSMLEFSLKMLGKQELAQRLFGSLQVDIAKTKNLLGWHPLLSVSEGLQRAAQWYVRNKDI